jgi:hypothetical protein
MILSRSAIEVKGADCRLCSSGNRLMAACKSTTVKIHALACPDIDDKMRTFDNVSAARSGA